MPIIEFTNLNKYGNRRTRRFWQEKSSLSINPKGLGSYIHVRLFKYTYEHPILPPTLTNIGGKRYIVPTWQEVLPETQLSDINWIKPKPPKKSETIVVEPPSSKGDKIYKTRYYPDTGNFTCTCPGVWMSKNNCKHIKKLRLEVNGR